MNETMYRIYKGGTILDPNTLRLNKTHQLIKHIGTSAYFKPLKQTLINDFLIYGKLHKIRNFYKDGVLIDYLLSDEVIKLQDD